LPLKSKEFNFHNNPLGSNLKMTDLDDDGIPFPGQEESLSLMWQDSLDPRPVGEDQFPSSNTKMARNLTMEFEDSEADPYSNFTPFEDTQPMSMVSQMDRILARKNNSENPCSMSGNPNQETLDTRPSNSVRPSFPSAKKSECFENILPSNYLSGFSY